MADEYMRKETCKERHDGLENRLEAIDEGIKGIHERLDRNGNGVIWKVLGIMLTFAVGIVAVVAALVSN